MSEDRAISRAVDGILRWRRNPVSFVREVFGVEPDAWQIDVLMAFPEQQRIAMKAAKGPGKSALLAWLAWYFLTTRPQARGAATSITADTLADTLWTEIAKWRNRSPFLIAKFDWQKTRISARESPDTWYLSARSWSRSADSNQQADTLAGIHADYVLFLLDEAGGIPDSVMAAAEAALSSCVEGHIVIAGNPTHLSGPLYRACTTEKRLWWVIEITGDPDDPKRSPRISVQWAKEQIEKYGRDNPWVLVNVFGKFPPSSLNALIGPDEMMAATKRVYSPRDYAHMARVFGVDVARFGDDASCIFPRQGLVAFNPIVMRNVDTQQGAGRVARLWQDWDIDGCFIDDTGGYGAAWIDFLRDKKFEPVGIPFSGKPFSGQYYNKRTEIYFELAEWIKGGGSIPDIPNLHAALTQTTYSFRGDKMLLEPKDSVKAKIGYSPDEADALALTFAGPVKPKDRGLVLAGRSQHQAEYDPFRSVNEAPQPSRHVANYNPFSGS